MSEIPDDMVDGYLDGFGSLLKEFPQGSNRSDIYRHGWLNGRDDRLGKPRASAGTLRSVAADLLSKASPTELNVRAKP